MKRTKLWKFFICTDEVGPLLSEEASSIVLWPTHQELASYNKNIEWQLTLVIMCALYQSLAMTILYDGRMTNVS